MRSLQVHTGCQIRALTCICVGGCRWLHSPVDHASAFFTSLQDCARLPQRGRRAGQHLGPSLSRPPQTAHQLAGAAHQRLPHALPRMNLECTRVLGRGWVDLGIIMSTGPGRAGPEEAGGPTTGTGHCHGQCAAVTAPEPHSDEGMPMRLGIHHPDDKVSAAVHHRLNCCQCNLWHRALRKQAACAQR